MVRPTSASRERFVNEARRLFATKGYAATTVADIQLACGLTAGSGALYKHFASKHELLRAVVQTHVETMRSHRQSFAGRRLPEDPRQTLRLIVQHVWSGMERDSDVLRVMMRDLGEAPELLEPLWQEVRANVYDELTGWLMTLRDSGTIRCADPEATAAVLLASLTYFPILDALIGHTPGDVPAEAFTEAWVEHAAATLGL